MVVGSFSESATHRRVCGTMYRMYASIADQSDVFCEVRGECFVKVTCAGEVFGVLGVVPHIFGRVLGWDAACARGLEDFEFMFPIMIRGVDGFAYGGGHPELTHVCESLGSYEDV